MMASLDPIRAVREGFAVVIQDTRGRFDSEGEFSPFDEGEDGFDCVGWVAAQPWCDGNVGMFGSSYMAATQLQAAAARPPALKAICPVAGSSDYYEGRSYRGGALELGALVTIALWALARGAHVVDDSKPLNKRMAEVRNVLKEFDEFLSVRPLDSLRATILGEVAPFFFDWATHSNADDYWSHISLEEKYPNFDVAALHVTSWFDQFHVGTLRNYEGLHASAGTQDSRDAQALVVGPWAHFSPRSTMVGSVRVGDVNFGLDALVDLEIMQMRWFRKYLKGSAGSWRNATPVRLFMMGENRWHDEESWPVKDVDVEPLFLGANGQLSWEPATDSGSATYVFDPRNPVPTFGGAHLVLESLYPTGPIDHQHQPARDDVLVYNSTTLSEPVEIVGWVEANLFIRSDCPSTDFTVKLLDVWPDGRILNVVDGIRRVSGADKPDESGWLAVRVEMGATAIRLLEGHRIQVHISSSNFPRFDVNSNTGESLLTATETAIARQTLCQGGPYGSYILLPVRRAGGQSVT